jgi:hypothetical protein
MGGTEEAGCRVWNGIDAAKKWDFTRFTKTGRVGAWFARFHLVSFNLQSKIRGLLIIAGACT